MIELLSVVKAFETNVLFDGLTLKIEDGDFLTFTGKSGSGKTTLLNIIGGLEKPNSGQVLVDGIDIYKSRRKSNYFGKQVSFLFQNFSLIESKTVKENLDIIPLKNRSIVSLESALDFVQLKDKMHAKVYTLSGGEQQRVALARIMLKQSSIILADEPTGSLDYENGKLVINKLIELNDNGKTIILVTHDKSIIPGRSKVIEL